MNFVKTSDGQMINLDRISKIVYQPPWFLSKKGYWRLYVEDQPFTIIEEDDPLFNKIESMVCK